MWVKKPLLNLADLSTVQSGEGYWELWMTLEGVDYLYLFQSAHCTKTKLIVLIVSFVKQSCL